MTLVTQTLPFAIDEWSVQEDALHLEHNTHAETLFALANGYIGTRGTFEEGVAGNPSSCEGTYLNGVYCRKKIHYEETAYGFASHNNIMIQVPNGKAISLTIDGESFVPGASKAEHYSRTLDFRKGMLERTVRWKTNTGKIIDVTSKRLVSLFEKHLMCVEYHVKAVNFSGDVHITSALDTHSGDAPTWDENDPRVGFLSMKESLDCLTFASKDEHLSFMHHIRGGEHLVYSACAHQLSANNIRKITNQSDNQAVSVSYHVKLAEAETCTLQKFTSYFDGIVGEGHELIENAERVLNAALEHTFDYYESTQNAALKAFWQQADVQFTGDTALQQGMRFNLFHIFQSAGRDGRRNIGAKGLTGPGYDGHYFWDTEIYIIPFFVFNHPHIARSLLEYRHSILDAARAHAREMAQPRGALYAWRTIGGEECSAYFPAGSAQYHINAAVAYAIRQYFTATQDWSFIRDYGAEMLFETARIWADLGFFCERRDGAFCINEVTGPDEYSAMVDNHFYTNAMARMHLRFAAEIAEKMKAKEPKEYAALVKRIGLDETEVNFWKKAVDKMYLPTDPQLGISPQDDTFLTKPVWDFENTPKDKHPLLLHFHPLVIYRHQVLKQADVVLAMVLLGDEFSTELKINNFNYYDPLTTHDSTLSTCMSSVATAEIGEYDKAYEFFGNSARMDLDNSHNNTEYGLHTACMAGSWMSIVMGFGGMRVREDQLHFAPHLPQKWQGYGFSILFRGSRIHISIKPESVTYTLLEGGPLSIHHYQDTVSLIEQSPQVINTQTRSTAA